MADDIMRIALIPAYKPDEALVGLLRELSGLGFVCVTVNDGSGDEYAHIFAEAKQYSAVLEHSVNLGKGAAIKTGLCHIYTTYHTPYTVVTLDADGQHSIEDAVRVSDKAAEEPDSLIIGCRNFKGKIPFRSRLGNSCTKAIFALLSGRRISDTQTGLRAFSDRHIQRMLGIRGDRYEYEMNVLMEYAKAKTTITEVPIETIYIDGNSSSHFRPVRDSYRIYKEILHFSLSSLVCFGLDYALFCIISALTGQTVIANIGARIVSAGVNFEINRRLVFKSKKSAARSAVGYFTLALFIMLCGTVLVTFLTETVGMSAYIAKIITEAVMFTVSWSVQHTAVFAEKKNTKGGMTKLKHLNLAAAAYAAVLVIFTGYVMLDTFVIPTVVSSDASAINTDMFADEQKTAITDTGSSDTEKTKKREHDTTDSHKTKKTPPAMPDGSFSKKSRPSSEDNASSRPAWPFENSGKEKLTSTGSSDGKSYKDDNISINISEYYENNTRIYVADVKLSSAQYLKTAFANDTYGKNVSAATSDTAAAKNAILAVNGDYYGARESGYVIRNGVIYRDYGSADTDVLCIYADGHFGITNSSEKTCEELIAEGVWQAFSFGPSLIENGTVTVTEKDEVGKAKASNPRTSIGIIDDKHYIFVVSDGRTSESEGLTLKQLADFMQKLGATTAYNLDGGGSSTMYFDGEVINNPTTSGNNISERKVSDIVYIG